MSRVSAELLSAPSSKPEVATAPSETAEPCTVLVNSQKGLPASISCREQRGREGASSSPADAAAGFLSQEVQLLSLPSS